MLFWINLKFRTYLFYITQFAALRIQTLFSLLPIILWLAHSDCWEVGSFILLNSCFLFLFFVML